MIIKSKLAQRIIIGKAVGAIFGGIAFFLIPNIFKDADLFLRFGVWLWYITIGVFIGLFGLVTNHPVLKFSMPFWFRGIVLGGWMNFVLCLFAYNSLTSMMKDTIFNGYSPFWIIVEGMLVGLITDYLATKFAGEGKDLIKK